MSTTVVEINDIQSLAGYRDAWRSLLAQMRFASFFQSLEWLEVYWRHFGANRKLRTLIVHDAEQIIGIVPLVVERETTRVGTIRTLTYPLEGWASFYGPVTNDFVTTLAAAFGHLRRTRRDWDLLDLRWIPPFDDQLDATQAALVAAGFDVEESAWEQAALIALDGTWDDYWQSVDGKQRNNVRRGERRLAELGQLEFIRHRPAGNVERNLFHLSEQTEQVPTAAQQQTEQVPFYTSSHADPRWDLFAECQHVAELSWQGSADDGTTLSSPGLREAFREGHQAATNAGASDICLLRIDGRPAAFAYSFHTRGYVYVIKVGFDPALSHAGAGKVLLMKLIEDSFRRDDRLVDLGPESFHYKRFWLNRLATSYRLVHFPGTSPRAQALRLARWVRDIVQPSATPPKTPTPVEA